MQGWEWAIGLAPCQLTPGTLENGWKPCPGPLGRGQAQWPIGPQLSSVFRGQLPGTRHRCHGGDYVLAVVTVPTVVRGSPGVSCPALLIPAVDPVWSEGQSWSHWSMQSGRPCPCPGLCAEGLGQQRYHMCWGTHWLGHYVSSLRPVSCP